MNSKPPKFKKSRPADLKAMSPMMQHPVFMPGDEVIYNGKHTVKVLMCHDDCTWILRGYHKDEERGLVEVIYAMKTSELKRLAIV